MAHPPPSGGVRTNMIHRLLALTLLALAAGCGGRAVVAPASAPAMPELRTVETAITTTIRKPSTATETQAGYLGISVGEGLVILDVAADSPASKAGLKAGDVVVEFAGDEVHDADELRDRIQGALPGDAVGIAVERRGSRVVVKATIGAVSRPMKLAERRAILGISLGEAAEGTGAPITRINRDSPAEKAGLKVGDVVLKVDDASVASSSQLTEALSARNPGDVVTLTVERGGKTEAVQATLANDPQAEARASGFFRGGNYWKKELYRLAVIGVEYPDVKHNAAIATKDWEEALFSKGTYSNKKNVSGRTVYGSLNDYYLELSCGAFRVEGRMFDWVEVGKKRADYLPGTGRNDKSNFVSEVVGKIEARDGKDALKDFDGLFLVFAGGSVQTSRGGLYWPHRSSATVKGKRWPYFIVPEGGARMSSISVIAHEFGHMLGLPDLYARPENPGSTGLGVWCAMSNQNGNGRPQHFSAWCKEQLGWLKPAIIDPTVKQRLVLGPVEGLSKECFKVLVRQDGSEYLLLENRRKTGFDKDLPGEGLIIWRVVKGAVMIEESHGVDGPSGPGVFLSSIPYPSGANNAFTPYTTPSSRSQLGGGLPVHITNIKRLADGRIEFLIGFDYQ